MATGVTVFRLLTNESLEESRRKQEEWQSKQADEKREAKEQKALEKLQKKEKKKNGLYDEDEEKKKKKKPTFGPSKSFEAGRKLPARFQEEFDMSLIGRPLEEVDPYFKTQLVSRKIIFSLYD